MLGKRKKPVIKDNEILENMKKDIKAQLTKNGVVISEIDMEMNTENISLSIFVRCFPPLIPRI